MKKMYGAKILKNINRKSILKEILKHKHISRADIAKHTGLNKATVSEQISDLLKDNLILEQESTQISVGRKPILVSLNGKAGYALGIDLDTKSLSYIVTDLCGNIILKKDEDLESTSFQYVLNILRSIIEQVIEKLPPSEYGLIGLCIGIHSLVEQNTIIYDPNFKWHNINIKKTLEEDYKVPTYIHNYTNLCAYAEKMFYTEANHLVCISLSSGIGAGIFYDKRIFRGHDGFAGEVGHMIIEQDGLPCPCGNKGCWEQYASEKAFLNHIAKNKSMPSCNLQQLENFIIEEDEMVIKAFQDLSGYLALGINNMINIFNPEIIVINSELLRLYPKIIELIDNQLVSSINHYSLLTLSTLGKYACSLGAVSTCINKFLDLED